MAETPKTPDIQPFAGALLNHASSASSTSSASAVERRLTADGERWARGLPAADALTTWADALPEPGADAGHTTDGAIHSTRGAPVAMPAASATSAPIALSHASPSKGRQPMFHSRFGGVRILATVAAVLVVALLATVFVALASSEHGIGLGGHPSGGPTTRRATPTAIPPTPGVYPGPQAQYVISAITAQHVGKHNNLIDPTTHFRAGETVYLVVKVRYLINTPLHFVSVVWTVGNRPVIDVAAVTTSGPSVASSSPIETTLTFMQVAGTPEMGMVRVYWDAANPHNPNDDRALGQTVVFVVS